jgi:hypothetical protein
VALAARDQALERGRRGRVLVVAEPDRHGAESRYAGI